MTNNMTFEWKADSAAHDIRSGTAVFKLDAMSGQTTWTLRHLPTFGHALDIANMVNYCMNDARLRGIYSASDAMAVAVRKLKESA